MGMCGVQYPRYRFRSRGLTTSSMCSANQVEGRTQERDRNARREHQIPILPRGQQIAGCLRDLDHNPPTHTDIDQTKEGQHGFDEDRIRDGDHHKQKRQRQQVRHQVGEDDVPVAASGDARRFDVGFDFDGQCLRFDDDGVAPKAHQDAVDDRQVEHLEVEHRTEDDHQRDEGQHHHHIGDAHEDHISRRRSRR